MLNSLQVLIVLIASLSVSCDEYEDNIEFILHNGHETHVSTFDTLLSEQGCDLNGNFSLVTHGWVGSNSGWIPDLISNLSFYRQGCVIFMNYSYYGDRKNYFEAISFFEPVSRLLTKKLFQITDEGVCHDHIFMFGFSLGGRIVIEAALNYGENLISAIDTCDMAGPGFDFIYKKDPKRAAKNVQCIHTSNNGGTKERKCHQDWLMGHCGEYQDAANDVGAVICELVKNCPSPPMLSHSLCPYFYNSAFRNDFLPNNQYKCSSKRMASNLPAGFKMGFMETRKNSSIIGDIPSPTSKSYPYNGV